jgi:hypothetical protein
LPAGICALSGGSQFVGVQRLRLVVEDGMGRRQIPIELVAVDESAASQAQHHNIQTDDQTHPQVNLKGGAAEPDSLRLPQPLCPRSHCCP